MVVDTLCVNVGIMGHVDSGKTSLLRALFELKGGVVSTAGHDKHPQSQQRGITLDLGFSSLPLNLPNQSEKNDSIINLCFVDCPGHASLLKTVLGAAQIVDRIVLVLDVTKGIQSQTLECLALAEILTKYLIIVLNKCDLLPTKNRISKLNMLEQRIKQVITEKTIFKEDQIFVVSTAVNPSNVLDKRNDIEIYGMNAFLDCLKKSILQSPPKRDLSGPFIFIYDHAFIKKGHGTVVTGTVISGSIKIRDEVCLAGAPTNTMRVRSIQSFKKDVEQLQQGDRGGLCLTTSTNTLIHTERGMLIDTKLDIPNMIEFIALVERCSRFKGTIASHSKFHITAGHTTVLATVLFFTEADSFESSITPNINKQEDLITASSEDASQTINFQHTTLSIGRLHPDFWSSYNSFYSKKHYCYLPELPAVENNYQNLGCHGHETQNITLALIRLDREQSFVCPIGGFLLGSRLDLDTYDSQHAGCRLAFFGQVLPMFASSNSNSLKTLFIARKKTKLGYINRINAEQCTVIGTHMFKTAEHVLAFVGLHVTIESSKKVVGKIEKPFGKTGKFLICLTLGQHEDISVGSRITLEYLINVLESHPRRSRIDIF